MSFGCVVAERVPLPDTMRPMRHILADKRVQRPMKQLAAAVAVIAVLAACSATPSRAPSYLASSSSVPLTTPNASPSLAAIPTAMPTLVPRCARGGRAAFPGVVEARPDGWVPKAEMSALPHFPNTSGQIYGPDGVAVPADEGPGRLTLFETFPASDAYLRSRIEQSRRRDGKPIAVTVCGEATQVWQDDSTGELVIGWTDRNKSDVLVANTADVSVKGLVASAESVYDCCG
jgi:hypothetical protein